jgi:hypothetical protein
MDRWRHSSIASTGFIVEKWSCGSHHQKDIWRTHSHLQTGVFMKVGGKAPGRSLGQIILNGPLTLWRSWLKGRAFLLSQKWSV